jgi:diguanylate cyclase (GGDEF)-like protein
MLTLIRSLTDRLNALHFRLLSYLMGGEGLKQPSAEQDAQKLINLVGISVLIAPSFAIYYAMVGLPELAVALAITSLVMLSAFFVYRVCGVLAFARDYFLSGFFCYVVYCGYYFGTVISPTTFWLTALPVVGVLLGSARSGAVWLALVLAFLVLVSGLTDGSAPRDLPAHLYAMSLAGMVVAIFLFVLMIDGARRRALSDLESANAAVTELARRDSLTGLYNRRYVWEALAQEESRARALEESFSILLVDIDRFKLINDTFGHVTGDIVLKDVASKIQSTISEHDFCGRYGGEEFLVLLRGRQGSDAASCAEQIRSTVAELSFGHVDGPRQVTVSIGSAMFEAGEAFTDTFKRADKALYSAKGTGRNRLVQIIREVPLAS